jgi:hypothetical protein
MWWWWWWWTWWENDCWMEIWKNGRAYPWWNETSSQNLRSSLSFSFNYFGLVFPIDEKENNDATFAGEKKENSEFNSSSGWLSLSEWVSCHGDLFGFSFYYWVGLTYFSIRERLFTPLLFFATILIHWQLNWDLRHDIHVARTQE